MWRTRSLLAAVTVPFTVIGLTFVMDTYWILYNYTFLASRAVEFKVESQLLRYSSQLVRSGSQGKLRPLRLFYFPLLDDILLPYRRTTI